MMNDLLAYIKHRNVFHTTAFRVAPALTLWDWLRGSAFMYYRNGPPRSRCVLVTPRSCSSFSSYAIQPKAHQQTLNDGEVVDGVHPPAHLYRPRRLGGSTASWGGRCVPLDEQDFQSVRMSRSADGLSTGLRSNPSTSAPNLWSRRGCSTILHRRRCDATPS
jgi:hypothetical protein